MLKSGQCRFDNNNMSLLTMPSVQWWKLDDADLITTMQLWQPWYKFNNTTSWNITMMKAGWCRFNNSNADLTTTIWVQQCHRLECCNDESHMMWIWSLVSFLFCLPSLFWPLTSYITGVGKTSLLHHYMQNRFNPKNTTSTSGTFFVTKVYMNGVKATVSLG